MPKKKSKKDQECQHCQQLFTSNGISKHEAACNNLKQQIMQDIQYRADKLAQDKMGKQRLIRVLMNSLGSCL
jgi:PHP family Zn ribbon phosphoesterase